MTTTEINKYIKEMNQFSKETSASPQKAKKFLSKTGIYTSTGKLTNHYKAGNKDTK